MQPWLSKAPVETELMLRDMLQESKNWHREAAQMEQNQYSQQQQAQPQPVWNPQTGRWEYPQPRTMSPPPQQYIQQQQYVPPASRGWDYGQQQSPQQQMPQQMPQQMQQYPQSVQAQQGQPWSQQRPVPPQQYPPQQMQQPQMQGQPPQMRPPQQQYPQQMPAQQPMQQPRPAVPPQVPPGVVPPKEKEKLPAVKKKKTLLYVLIGLMVLSMIAFVYTVIRFLTG